MMMAILGMVGEFWNVGMSRIYGMVRISGMTGMLRMLGEASIVIPFQS